LLGSLYFTRETTGEYFFVNLSRPEINFVVRGGTLECVCWERITHTRGLYNRAPRILWDFVFNAHNFVAYNSLVASHHAHIGLKAAGLSDEGACIAVRPQRAEMTQKRGNAAFALMREPRRNGLRL
jgi:hypothetical protein